MEREKKIYYWKNFIQMHVFLLSPLQNLVYSEILIPYLVFHWKINPSKRHRETQQFDKHFPKGKSTFHEDKEPIFK